MNSRSGNCAKFDVGWSSPSRLKFARQEKTSVRDRWREKRKAAGCVLPLSTNRNRVLLERTKKNWKLSRRQEYAFAWGIHIALLPVSSDSRNAPLVITKHLPEHKRGCPHKHVARILNISTAYFFRLNVIFYERNYFN